jgi:hypothetical protein
MVEKPLTVGIISALVFGGIILGLKGFVFLRTGEFTRMDFVEVIVWFVFVLVWPLVWGRQK